MLNINNLITTIKNNQFLVTGLGLSGAGIISFWLKDIPARIFRLLIREVTTELVITSQNKIFYDVLKWFESKYKHKNFRNLKLSNGLWVDSNETITSIGYGIHFIKYKGQFLRVSLIKEQANQTNNDKDTLVITKLGRSHSLFREIIEEVLTITADTSRTKIFKLESDFWRFMRDLQKRDLDSIFIEGHKKSNLLKSINDFISKEKWYIEKGIPYQLGILLYGPPGTGKTSLIRAVASYLNYNIYYLSANNLSKIETASASLPDKCIMVIEDIDSNSLTHSRTTKSENKNKPIEETADLLKELNAISLAEVLNALDGIFSTHGRILIATTNHIENLDNALIRPGRIDLQIEIGYVNNDILYDFIKCFFPDSKKLLDNICNLKIKENITVAMLQNMVLLGHSANTIVDSIIEVD